MCVVYVLGDRGGVARNEMKETGRDLTGEYDLPPGNGEPWGELSRQKPDL